MSDMQAFNPDTVPADQYTQEKGRHIAESFAAGESLQSICENSEGWLPAMLYVRRWRVMFPAFDALMCEAASCRAENMAEEILIISDDHTAQAAHNRNRMAAREKLAGWMAPAEYGDRRASDSASDADQAPVYVLTDDQLLAIAAGKLAPAIDGECVTVEPDPVPPPLESAPGIEYEVPDPEKPGISLAGDSVTTIKPDKIEVEHSVTTSKILEPGEPVRSFVGMD